MLFTFPFLRVLSVLHGLPRAKNTLLACSCQSICRVFPRRYANRITRHIVTQQWKPRSVATCCGDQQWPRLSLLRNNDPKSVGSLFYDAFSVTRLYTADDREIREWRWIEKDLAGSGRGVTLRYYPGIRLEGLRKTAKNRSPGPRFEPGTYRIRSGRMTLSHRWHKLLHSNDRESHHCSNVLRNVVWRTPLECQCTPNRTRFQSC
jgi:hypothetical protein